LPLSRTDTWAVRASAAFWFIAASAYGYLSIHKLSPTALCFGIAFAALAIGVLRLVPWVMRCAVALFLLADLLILCGPLNPFFALGMQLSWNDVWLFGYVSGWLSAGAVLFWLAARTDRVRALLQHD
ncbi:MAG TPA: hypothetical protein VJR89_29390, partial [Polyangiales bacterium]|nr:hypothetical protein [Polyangiales bacterium]